MKLIELHNFQDDGFKEAERGTPSPCIGEVVIKVHAASLNFRDFMIAKGLYNPNIELLDWYWPRLFHIRLWLSHQWNVHKRKTY